MQNDAGNRRVRQRHRVPGFAVLLAPHVDVTRNPQTRGFLGYAYAKTGRREEAEQSASTSRFPNEQALIFAGLWDKDRTYDALTRMAELGPPARRSVSQLSRVRVATRRRPAAGLQTECWTAVVAPHAGPSHRVEGPILLPRQ